MGVANGEERSDNKSQSNVMVTLKVIREYERPFSYIHLGEGIDFAVRNTRKTASINE